MNFNLEEMGEVFVEPWHTRLYVYWNTLTGEVVYDRPQLVFQNRVYTRTRIKNKFQAFEVAKAHFIANRE